MEAPFDNYADFCAKMAIKVPVNSSATWERWDKNQALFEYFIRDTTQSPTARMRAYKILYYGLHPEVFEIDRYTFPVRHTLIQKINRKMLAQLLYDYFKTADTFDDWGRPYIATSFICRDLTLLLREEMIPFLYKELNNAERSPMFNGDWRSHRAKDLEKLRYADYAYSYLCSILAVPNYPADDFDLYAAGDYEIRKIAIARIKPLVEAYCVFCGIDLNN